MRINFELDLGRATLSVGPLASTVGDALVVEGGQEIVWASGGRSHVREQVIRVKASSAIGGAAAGSKAAASFLVEQLKELASNPQMQPVFIEWQSGDGITVADPNDGWWRLDVAEPLEYGWPTHIPVRVRATLIALGTTNPQAMGWDGGAVTSGYSAGALLRLPLPPSTYNASGFTRNSADSVIPYVLSPTSNPFPYEASIALNQWFQGRVRVYDQVDPSYAPPTNGTFVHANWVEVRSTRHRFTGNLFVTNGLLLLGFGIVAGVNQGPTVCDIWGWDQTVPAWVYVTSLWSIKAPISYPAAGRQPAAQLDRVSAEECAITVITPGATSMVSVRLQRGETMARIGVSPRSAANAADDLLFLQPTQNTASPVPTVLFNTAAGADLRAGNATLPTTPADYGFAAAMNPTATSPSNVIFGWLYQNAPQYQGDFGNEAPQAVSSPAFRLGDTTGPALKAWRYYGIFVIFKATLTNFYSEAESGTYTGANWATVADAGAQGAGNAAKLTGAAATVGMNDQFGVAQVGTLGPTAAFFRLRVSAVNANAVATWRVGMIDTTAGGGAFHAGSYVDLAPNSFGATGYLVIRTGLFTPVAAHNMRFGVWLLAAAPPVDLFVDNAWLAQIEVAPGSYGPGDVFREFIFDKSLAMALG